MNATSPAFECDLPDEAATLRLGRELAHSLDPGAVVFIQGELGAGKTTLCRGILRAMGVKGAVKSPTFTLVEPYELAGRQIFHFDLYRLADPNELEYIGIDDYFGDGRLCLVEWAERGEGFLPDCDLRVTLELADGGRKVTIEPRTERGGRVCQKLERRKGELQAR